MFGLTGNYTYYINQGSTDMRCGIDKLSYMNERRRREALESENLQMKKLLKLYQSNGSASEQVKIIKANTLVVAARRARLLLRMLTVGKRSMTLTAPTRPVTWIRLLSPSPQRMSPLQNRANSALIIRRTPMVLMR